MDNINLMEYQQNGSDEDYNVMNVLYSNKKNSYFLLFGHLVIEKIKNIEKVRTWLKSLLIQE